MTDYEAFIVQTKWSDDNPITTGKTYNIVFSDNLIIHSNTAYRTVQINTNGLYVSLSSYTVTTNNRTVIPINIWGMKHFELEET